ESRDRRDARAAGRDGRRLPLARGVPGPLPAPRRRRRPHGDRARPKLSLAAGTSRSIPLLGDGTARYRASECRAMRSPAQIAALCAAFVIALSTVSVASATVFSRTSESRILSGMNRVRAANGLRPLRYAAKLHAAARAHSADMIRRGYFGHGAFARRMDGFGVNAPVVGENLAWGSGVYGAAATIVHG